MTEAVQPQPVNPDWRLMSLRYAGRCRTCDAELPRGEQAYWSKSTRAVRCVSCHGRASTPADKAAPESPQVVATTGLAGTSAEREWQRRHDKRRERVLQRHPRIGGLLLAITDEPQSTRAWSTGATGERRVGTTLDGISRDDVVVLHDRRIPGKLSNIDHIVVGPAGVFVIDTKNYDGRLEVRDKGGWFKKDLHLYVGGRDRFRDVEGIAWQVKAIADALGGAGRADVVIHPVLCFVAVEWPLFGRPREFAGVRLAQPSDLSELVASRGDLEAASVQALADVLARALKPA